MYQYFLSLKKSNSDVLCCAHRVQGAAGPSGCDAGHWQDVLLRCGVHSDRLREAVSALAWRLTNTNIRALISN